MPTRTLIVMAALLLGTSSFVDAQDEAVTVRLHERAEVASAMVRLSDVARITPAGPTADRLGSTELLPRPGGDVTLDAFRIQSVLRAAHRDVQFTLAGKSRVKITPVDAAAAKSVVLDPRAGSQKVLNHRIHTMLQQSGYVTGLFSVSSMSESPLPAWATPRHLSIATLRIIDRPQESQFRLVLDLRDERGQTSRSLVTAHVQLQRRVLTVNKDVRTGQRLTTEDLVWTSVPLSTEGISNPQDVLGQVVKTAIQSGTPLTSSLVRTAILVKRGQLVTGKISSNGLTIRRMYIAESEGSRGDIVELRDEQRTVKLTGRVIDSRVVQLTSLSHTGATPTQRPGAIKFITSAPAAK